MENLENEKIDKKELKEEKTEVLICSDCGKEIENDNYFTTADGRIICEECFQDNYYTCTHCGGIFYNDDYIVANDTDNYFCRECGVNNLYYCDACGEYYENDENFITLHDGDNICQNCYDWGNYSYCEDCGEYYHNDDMEYCEENGEYYCYNCIEEIERRNANLIKSYHDHKGQFEKQTSKRDKAKTPLYLGFELETENFSFSINNGEMAKKIDDIMQGLVVFERDGSLNNGIEIISQPMTQSFIKDIKNKFEKMLEELRNNGFKSHDTSTCGLHIHLSREYFTENEIDKMQLILEQFKNEFVIFSRRSLGQIDSWAKFIKDNYIKDKVQLRDIKNLKERCDRYYALNRTNRDTIELRLFKGTLKQTTFFATLQLAFVLSKIVKQKSTKDIEKMNFKDIVTYKNNYIELKDYCIERGLL